MPCFYEANHASIPQIHTCWSQSIWRASGCYEVMRVWPHGEIHVLTEDTGLFAPCDIWGRRGADYRSKTSSPATETAAPWPWTSLPPRLWESTCLLLKTPGLLHLSMAAHLQATRVKSKVSLSSAFDPLHDVSGQWSLQSPNLMWSHRYLLLICPSEGRKESS